MPNESEIASDARTVRGAPVRCEDLLGCPWCGGKPEIAPMKYRNTGNLFGYKLNCVACRFEMTACPAGWQMGEEHEAMENAYESLVAWWNNRVQPNDELSHGSAEKTL